MPKLDFEIVIQNQDDYDRVLELLESEKSQRDHYHRMSWAAESLPEGDTVLDHHITYLETLLAAWTAGHAAMQVRVFVHQDL